MTDAPVIARRVVVHGHVQGVFFRASTRDVARRHGVAGWVRNDPGGTVSAHLEGRAEDVDAVLDWIRAGGPAHATVTELDVQPASATGATGFHVRG